MKLWRQLMVDSWRPSARYFVRILGVLVTMGAGSLAGFLSALVAARLYSPEAIGFAGMALTGASLANAFGNLGIIPLILRRLSRYEHPHHLMNLSYTLGGSANLIIAVAYSLLIPLDGVCSSFACEFVARSTFVLLAVSAFLHAAQDSALFALDLSYRAAVRTVIAQAGRIAIITILAGITQIGVVIGAALSFGVVAVWVHRTILAPRIGSFRFSLNHWRSVLNGNVSYLFSNYLIDCLVWIPAALIPLLLGRHLSLEASGLYYVASGAFNTAVLPVTAIATAELSSQSSSADSGSVRLKTMMLTFGTALAASVVLIGMAPLLPNLFGARYQGDTVLLLEILALSILPAGFTHMYLIHARLQLSMIPAVALFAVSTAGFVGLSWVLMLSNGLLGVGVAVCTIHWVSGFIAAVLWWRDIHCSDSSLRVRSAVSHAVSTLLAGARALFGGL